MATDNMVRLGQTAAVQAALITTASKLNSMPASPVEPTCPECLGEKWLSYGHDLPLEHANFGKLYACPRCNTMTTEQRLKATGLSAEMLAWTFESLGPPHKDNTAADVAAFNRAVATFKAFAEGRGKTPWLMVVGGPGGGKSRLGTAVLIHRAQHPEHGPSGRFYMVGDLLDEIKATFNAKRVDEGDTYSLLLDSVRAAPLLMLDDLGAEKETPWVDQELHKLLDYRVREKKETIITTNADPRQMQFRLADRILSRHTGLVEVVTLNIHSYRTGKKYQP